MIGVGIHDGISAADYHADAICPEPSLSRSGIVLLSNGGTLADFAANNPRLRNPEWPALTDDSTDASDLGTIVHRIVLGVGCDFEVKDPEDFMNADGITPSETWGSKAAKAFKADCEARGVPIIGREKFKMAQMIAAKLSAALLARFGSAWTERKCEQTVIAKRRLNDGSEIWCRARIDALLSSAIVDAKTTALSLSDVALGAEIARKGLDIQAAFYQDVLRAARLTTDPATLSQDDPTPFIFAYQQTVPPYATRFVNMDDPDVAWPLAMTRMDIDVAAHRFGSALKSGTWPDAPIDAKPVCPSWWKEQQAWRLLQAGFLEDSE